MVNGYMTDNVDGYSSLLFSVLPCRNCSLCIEHQPADDVEKDNLTSLLSSSEESPRCHKTHRKILLQKQKHTSRSGTLAKRKIYAITLRHLLYLSHFKVILVVIRTITLIGTVATPKILIKTHLLTDFDYIVIALIK